MISFLSIFFLVASGLSGSRYQSDNYGYSFSYKAVATFCAETPPAPSRGFSFSMKEVSCDDLGKRAGTAYVHFWAEYNVVRQADGARHLATDLCAGKSVLSHRGFSGLTTFECKSIEADQNKLHFFAQSKGDSVAVEQRINYYATVFLSGDKSDEELVAQVHRISVGEQR